jgi:hypothetical protein
LRHEARTLAPFFSERLARARRAVRFGAAARSYGLGGTNAQPVGKHRRGCPFFLRTDDAWKEISMRVTIARLTAVAVIVGVLAGCAGQPIETARYPVAVPADSPFPQQAGD